MNNKSIISTTLALLATALLFGCATGSSIVTGTTRPAIPAESVKMYLEPPADYEVIGMVRAASDAGWTEQGSVNYAVKELKRQAGKLGANGVLISSTGTKPSAVAGNADAGIFFGSAVESQTVQGRAVFVKREK